jgi:hypothetical protein
LLAFLFSCAHPVNPGGGLKDFKAPVVLESIPENGSANFGVDRFTIEFNEFIKLEDVQNQVLISPPLNETPDFKIKGKSLLVKFNENLKPNTTYSVYFGDAITDITEGNPVSNYTYIFSTGVYVDSLSMQGVVVEAFNHKPVEDCFVMLYKDNNDTISLDSLPLNLRPYYLSKTDESGRFRFNGLGDDEYLLFAILDMNSSLSFDQPNEKIAFLDSLINPSYVVKPIIDSTLTDSTLVVDADLVADVDTIQTPVSDSLLKLNDNLFSSQLETYELFLYQQKDTILKLLSSKVIRDNTLQFAFNLPADDVVITTLNFSDRELWYVSETSKDKDTITWYYHNLPMDTLEVLMKNQSDTLELLTIRLKKPKFGKKKKEEVALPLTWTANPASKILKPNTNMRIDFNQPIEIIKFDSAVLISGSDTILKPPFYFTDSLKMQIEIPIENKEATKYKIAISDSSIYDWNALANEDMLLNFSTRALSEYGNLNVNITNPLHEKVIVQLLNEKEDVLEQSFFAGDTVLVYKYLNPTIHKLKVIYDENANGKWDAGNYLKKIQAERIDYFGKELKLRANWDIEEDWELD